MLFIQFTPKSIFVLFWFVLFCFVFLFCGFSLFCHFLLVFNLLFVKINKAVNKFKKKINNK